ncbi:MAG: TolC family protein [Alphaproteobacteria bacterium]|nr:TolC family protein [Alphaproteobacteria bacterium]
MAALAAAALLSGCAGRAAQEGFAEVSGAARARLGEKLELVWLRDEAEADALKERTRQLLAEPLDAERAVQVMLLNNRALQGALAELGFAAADMMESILPRGPGYSYKRDSGGGDVELERTVTFDLLGLLTLPVRAQVESDRYAGAKRRAAGRVIALAGETRRAYYQAIAAAQLARYLEDATAAAEASAELAARLAGVGNLPRLDAARARAFHLEAASGLARARAAEVGARERLTRALSLWGPELAYTLPERLPDLPAAARQHDDIEALAVANRADLKVARAELEATARSLGLVRVTRLVSALSLSLDRHRETGEAPREGFEIDVSVPLFDFGEARVAKAEHLYMRAVHRLAETALNARSEVREAYLGYRTVYDVARRYREEIVPLRRTISEEVLLRYNGMLASVFELLADAREQIAGVSAAIAATRDFWLAEIALEGAIHGLGSPPVAGLEPTAAPAAPAAAEH